MEREWDPDADANEEKEEARENNDLLEGEIIKRRRFFFPCTPFYILRESSQLLSKDLLPISAEDKAP